MSYYTYKGMRVYKNESDFGTEYISVVNPDPSLKRNGKLAHIHTINLKAAKRVIDCFRKMKGRGNYWQYSRETRNKAIKLSGQKIHSKY